MKTIYESDNYIILNNGKDFELHRKTNKRTMFMNRSKYSTSLIVALKNLENVS